MSFEISVPGTTFRIKSGTIYTVTPKLDPDAPEAARGYKGYKEYGTTKPINSELTNTINPPFNTDMNVWDLGFHETSPCLRGLDSDTKQRHLNTVKKHIIEPIEEIKGKGFLSHLATNKELDNFPITIGLEVIFNTDNPLDLFKLYCAALDKEVAPKEEERNPIYRKAQFCIENKEKQVDNLQKRALQQDKATAKFYRIYEDDQEFALRVLNYIGIPATANSSEVTINTFFRNWMNTKDRSGANAEYFLEKVEKFSTETGKEELYLYEHLEDLVKKDVIKKIKSDYILRGESIGQNLKIIAEQAVHSKELKKTIMEEVISQE